MISRTRVPFVALAAGLLLAAGCGGSDESDDETSGASDWASSVCSATTTWTESLSDAVASLQDGNLSEDNLESAVDDITEATSTFTDDLKDAGRPDTEDGQQAQDLVEQLADDVEEGAQAIEDTVDTASDGTDTLTAISEITATLATMSSEVGGTIDQLEQLDAAGELEDAIADSDECSSLRSDE